MNSLLKNAGIPQLRCRVVACAFLYEMNVHGEWQPSNYQYVSELVEKMRNLDEKKLEAGDGQLTH